MSDDASDSLLPFASAGGLALAGGVVCCLGLKLIGGAMLFGGLATTIGITTDQTTFVVGGLTGLLLTVFVLGYRRIQWDGVSA